MNRKSLITCALVAAGIISQASADDVVYLTGSTAFRGNVYTAIKTGGVFDGNTITSEGERGGTTQSGANYMVFHGNINGTPTFINCAWSGSAAGIASICNVSIDNDGIPLFGAPEQWIKTTITDFQTAAPTAGELDASHQGDLAMSDTTQASSFPTTQFVANTATDIKDYGTVAIVTFTWAKNNNTASGASAQKTAWSNLSNVSTYQLQNLLATGAQTVGFFTGQSADTNTFVYLVGRNKGSGTRANVLNDTQYGLANGVSQFSIGGAGNLNGTPDGTLSLDSVGDNGYESGGSVAAALGTPGSTSNPDPNFGEPGWMAIGYASTGDAQKSGLTIANNWLTYNGVLESDGAIEQGSYSFWGHEHLYGKHNIVGTSADTVGGKLFTALHTGLATSGSVPTAHSSGINTAFMSADKSNDFATPAHF